MEWLLLRYFHLIFLLVWKLIFTTRNLDLPKTFQRQSMAAMANTANFHAILQQAPYTPGTTSTIFLGTDNEADLVFASALNFVNILNVALEAVLTGVGIGAASVMMRSEVKFDNGRFDARWSEAATGLPPMILEFKWPFTILLSDWVPCIVNHRIPPK